MTKKARFSRLRIILGVAFCLLTLNFYSVYSQGLFTQQQKLNAFDPGAGDLFGISVAISNDTAVVGSFHDDDLGSNSGSAYVYVRIGSSWVLQQKLIAFDGAPDDEFGRSVAIDGNTIVVGSWKDDFDGTPDSSAGSAYVFVRTGSGWVLQQKLQASDSTPYDAFGWSVAISGNTIVAGTPFDGVMGPESGSAYVFERSGVSWIETQKISQPDGAANDNFGDIVAIDGNTIAVGAYNDDDFGFRTGSAYVFVRTGSGWILQQKLLPSDAAAGDTFGYGLAISGDTIVVGSPSDADRGLDSGSAYIFVRSGVMWNQQQKIIGSLVAPTDQFGFSVGISGNMVTVGSPFHSNGPTQRAGLVYVFTRSGATWTEQQNFVTSDPGGAPFGDKVAINGQTLIVGVPFDRFIGEIQITDAGAAYIYAVTNSPPFVTINSPPSGAIFPINTPVSFTGSFTDNPGDTHTALWTFDSINQPGGVNESANTVNANYTFTTPGVYLVSLAVTDQFGAVGTANTVNNDLRAMVVIYDPNGGFVTGGGWIDSPAGAFRSNPGLSGKATFGFVSKYLPGANIPTGNTEFQFKTGNFNFSSTNYEWLVVAGARAQFKGSGTINGNGDYAFMLTAIDGQSPGGGGIDRFRIKIWDKINGGIIYDNQVAGDLSDNGIPNTALGGGNIVIHNQ